MLRPGNSFKRRVGKGPPLFGFWLSLCSPAAAEITAHSGADWVLIDMEHAPNELSSVSEQLRAAEEVCPVIVRPPDSSQTIVKRLLDIGVKSLMFPMIDTPAQAQAAVSWTRYPPGGVRGMASVVRANGYGRDPAYRTRQEEEVCVIVQAETPLALANIPEIAAIDGVDAIFIGPSDLAAAMEYAGAPEAPVVQKAIRDGLQTIKRAGKAAGALGYGAANARSLCADGADFVAVGADHWLLARETTALIAACRAERGDGET